MKNAPLLAALFGLAAAVPAHAATLSFQQGANGYSGTADTTLVSSDPDTAHGSDDFVSIDASDGGSPNHVLLRFDNLFGNGPGQIKSSDTIVSAKITFTVSSAGSGVNFHDQLQPWNEATITWNSAVNGIQANGVEASVLPFLSLGANNGGSNIPSGVPLLADVTTSLQAAQAGTVPGYGWALLPFMPNGTNGLDFQSREAFMLAERPLLTVEVTPVPEPGTYALLLGGLALVGAAARRRVRPR